MPRRGTGPMTLARPALPDELLTIECAAVRIGMSARHIRRLVAERRIPFYRLGRAIRLDPRDLAAYVSSGRVEPLTYESVWNDLRSAA